MFRDELNLMLQIKKPFIVVKSELEKEVYVQILNTLLENNILKIHTWNCVTGIQEEMVNNGRVVLKELPKAPNMAPFLIQREINNIVFEDTNTKDRHAFIIKDDGNDFRSPQFIRVIRNLIERNVNKYVPIIMITPYYESVPGLDYCTHVIDYDVLTYEDVTTLLETYEEARDVELPNKENIAKMFTGFNRQEIIELLDVSFAKYGELKLDTLKEKKVELVKKSNVLDWKEATFTMDDIGGNANFKRWFDECKICMTPEAKDYGIENFKGCLMLGLPGTSKSVMASVMANELGVPFLKLNMSKVLSKLVGESEKNIEKAINIAKSCSPCVLLIDEVEKNLGGYASSNASDSGTLSRVFGSILDMMVEDNGIIVVMTSNNVRDLPPELTRAGRLDATWFFQVPNEGERSDIFDIHLRKRHQKVSKTVLDEIAKETEGYTGAEIEQIAKSAIKKAYVRKVKSHNKSFKLTVEDLVNAKNDIIPVTESSKEKMEELEEWAKGRALFASEKPTKRPRKRVTTASADAAAKLIKGQ